MPAGIIGNTFCSSAISNQISAGPSTAWAARIVASTSSVVVALNAGIPYASASLMKSGPGQVRGVVVARVDDLLPLADHPELLVVEERDLHRDPVRREGHQLLAGHLEAAVAGQTAHVSDSGCPSAAPIAAGTQKPIVPRPPELMWLCGRRNPV